MVRELECIIFKYFGKRKVIFTIRNSLRAKYVTFNENIRKLLQIFSLVASSIPLNISLRRLFFGL